MIAIPANIDEMNSIIWLLGIINSKVIVIATKIAGELI